VSIYPTGFSLLPVGESAQGSIGLGEDGETLVTVGSQILLKLARGTGLYPRSVTAAIDIMSESIVTIKESLINSHPIFYRSGQDPSPIFLLNPTNSYLVLGNRDANRVPLGYPPTLLFQTNELVFQKLM
jgi:hypothetical protein